jgi:hypothetical protein
MMALKVIKADFMVNTYLTGVSVLKKMPMPTMPNVKRNGITGKKTPHIRWQPKWPAPHKDMSMIV